MPLVKPNKDEKREDFLKRCMANQTMNSEFPDRDQRYAVCNTQWRNRKKEYNMDKMIKYANMQEVKSVDSDNRIIEFIASKEIPDYDMDIVKLDGMDITKIKKNKSFLWSHMQTERPIGKILKVWRDGNTLKGKAQMTSEEEYDFGYSIYKLIKGGYINNISISFLPDYKSIEYKENKKTGERTQIINKSTLLECSAVNIGCNTGTSIQVKSFKDGINKAWDDDIIDGKELSQLDEAIDSLEKDVEEVVSEEMDYEAEIKMLKDEMEELKSGSYLYSIFDKEEDNSLDKLYDDIMEEKEQEHETLIKQRKKDKAEKERLYDELIKQMKEDPDHYID